MSDIDRFVTGGAPSFKFEQVGDQIRGIVTYTEISQQRAVDTGIPKVWADGTPVMQLVITIDDGDGEHAIYAKGGRFDVATGKGTSMLDAIKTALTSTGIKASQLVGHQLTVKHSGIGKKTNPAYSPPKLFQAAIVLTPSLTGDTDDEEPF